MHQTLVYNKASETTQGDVVRHRASIIGAVPPDLPYNTEPNLLQL